uniref:Uncharacterized protein n=1 Tax=Timema cristinae TaxID=61476 RepID=A0A7R9DRF7_TIMCR|nr:unnamed protein product [Timema cristinae]
MMQLSEPFGKKPLLESRLKVGKNVYHTEKIINDDWAKEKKMDASETQPFIIQIGNKSDSDEEEEVLAVPLLPD